jgi:hypothetical protein
MKWHSIPIIVVVATRGLARLGFKRLLHCSKEARIWLLPFANAHGFTSEEGNILKHLDYTILR